MPPISCHSTVPSSSTTSQSPTAPGTSVALSDSTLASPFEHYHCHCVIDSKTKSLCISDTVIFCHHYLTIPTVTLGKTIVHSLNAISNAITNAPSTTSNAQLHTISTLHDLFSWWEELHTIPTATPPHLHTAALWPTSTPL